MGTMILHLAGQFPEESKLPPPGSTGRKGVYRFEKLEVGDSVYVNDSTRKMAAAAAATYYGQRTGKKFRRKSDLYGVLITRIY